MAKIKLAKRSRGPSKDVPTSGGFSGGIAAGALAGLGGTIQQISADFLEKERIAEANQQETLVMTEAQKAFNQIGQDNSKAFEGTPHVGFKKNNLNELDSRINELRGSVTSSRAKRILDLKLKNFRTEAEIKWGVKETSKRTEFWRSSDETSRAEKKRLSAESLDFDVATVNLMDDRNIRQSNIGIVWNQKEMDAIAKKDSDFGVDLVLSKIQAGGAHLEDNRKFLNNPDPEHKVLLDTIGVKERLRLHNMNEAAIRARDKTTSKTSIEFADEAGTQQILSVEKRGFVDANSRNAAIQAAGRLDQLIQKDPKNKDLLQAKQKLRNDILQAGYKQRMHSAEFGQAMNINPEEFIDDSKSRDSKDNLATLSAMQDARKEFANKAIKDSGSLVPNTFVPGTKEFFNYQESKNYPSPMYGDKELYDTERSIFNASQNKTQTLMEFRSKYPMNGPMLSQIHERGGDGDLSDFVIANEMSDPGTMNHILSGQHKEDRKLVGDTEFNSLKDKVKEQLDPLMKAFGRNSGFKNVLSEKMTSVALDHISKGHSEDDALKLVQQLMDREYQVASVGNINILLTAKQTQKMPDLKPNLEAFVEWASDPRNADEFVELTGVNPEDHGFVPRPDGEVPILDIATLGLTAIPRASGGRAFPEVGPKVTFKQPSANQQFMAQVMSAADIRLNETRDGLVISYFDIKNGRSTLLKARGFDGPLEKPTAVRKPLNIPFSRFSITNSPFAEPIIRQRTEDPTREKIREGLRRRLKASGMSQETINKTFLDTE